jgi:hypothetical protein
MSGLKRLAKANPEAIWDCWQEGFHCRGRSQGSADKVQTGTMLDPGYNKNQLPLPDASMVGPTCSTTPDVCGIDGWVLTLPGPQPNCASLLHDGSGRMEGSRIRNSTKVVSALYLSERLSGTTMRGEILTSSSIKR